MPPLLRSRRLRILLGLLLAAALWVLAGLPDHPSGAPVSGTLRVAASNLYLRNPSPNEATQALIALRPDLLLVTELTPRNAVRATLHAAGLAVVVDAQEDNARGIGLWARAGLDAQAEVRAPPWEGPCEARVLVARVASAAGPFAFIGAHTPPPIEKCQDTNALAAAALARWIVDGALAKNLGPARAGDPVVLAGDLNALPVYPQILRLHATGLWDVLLGDLRPHPTWPAHGPGFAAGRIDYVWAPRGWAVDDRGTTHAPGSDHLAVWADLQPG